MRARGVRGARRNCGDRGAVMRVRGRRVVQPPQHHRVGHRGHGDGEDRAPRDVRAPLLLAGRICPGHEAILRQTTWHISGLANRFGIMSA